MTKTILIVAAHPDDEVLGCFGTVAKMIEQGYEAFTLILSPGKASRNTFEANEIEILKGETIQANNSIGIKEVFQAEFPDNMFDSVPILNIVKKIEEIKEKVKPEIIFTHHIGDLNVDHQITHKAVLTATRPMKGECVKAIYAMEVPSATEWNGYSRDTAFIPNIFSDIKNTIDKKIKAMELYKSELREYPHPRSLEYLKELAKTNGAKSGLDYAECFQLVRKIY